MYVICKYNINSFSYWLTEFFNIYQFVVLLGVHMSKALPQNLPHRYCYCEKQLNHKSNFLSHSCFLRLKLDRGNHSNCKCQMLKKYRGIWRNPFSIKDKYWFLFTPERQNTLLWTQIGFQKCLNFGFSSVISLEFSNWFLD